MTPSSLSFEQASRKIVSDFLHSVVVVDDRASLNDELNKRDSDAPKQLEGNPFNRAKKIQEILKESPQQSIDGKQSKVEKSEPEGAGDNYSSRGLNAKILIDSFAEIGLVCAVLKPIDHEADLNIKTDHATQKSDIVILDWQISETETTPGSIAISLIKQIISTDSPGRLRLIAIYTTNQDLHGIAEKIRDTIKTPDDDATISNFEISRGPIKVVIYQKSGGSTRIAPERVVEEVELPEKLIGDFTKLTQGLLSNVALKSLGALRENTHRILNKFSSDLDASYITHRVLSNPPVEAETHPIPLLASELLDVLEDCNIKNLVSAEFLEKWLEYQIDNGLSFNGKFEGISHEDALVLIKELIKNGVDKSATDNINQQTWNSKFNNLKNKKYSDSFLTGLFSLPNSKDVKERDMDFAILTTIKSKYESPAPLLTLGSIVVENVLIDETSENEYYLCIQPLCDSVRLEKSRRFSFIPLDISTRQDKFNLVVKDKGVYVKLLNNLKPYNTLMIEFNPLGKGEILALKNDEDWVFTASDGIRKMRWVADLKFPHAQRIITQYSEQLGRVGLTESDWLRRMG